MDEQMWLLLCLLSFLPPTRAICLLANLVKFTARRDKTGPSALKCSIAVW